MELVRRAEDEAPTFDNGDQAWVLASTTLVFLMIPGVGYFYSGMARSKNARRRMVYLGLFSST
jgi:ammonia channel protein AmtB